jgi:hypothetical protein
MSTARTALVIGGAAGAAGAAEAVRRRLADDGASPGHQGGGRADRWLAVTVNRSPAEVGPADSLPEPFARLREEAEVRIRPAAGGKGTELLARPAAGGDVSRPDLRVALRETKSLLETGTVIQPDVPPSTHPGPAGRVLRAVTHLSRKEGRL